MLIAFVIIVLLTAILVIPNALYALRQFLTDRSLVWLCTYAVFLAILGYLVIHLANRTVQIVMAAQEVMAQRDAEIGSHGRADEE